MVNKLIFSFVFVFFTLTILKMGVDACLPYRGSAILPMLQNRETFYCQSLADWDQYGRLKRTQIFEVLAVPMSQMEKNAINPSIVGWGDLLLFWRIPLILPLILEQVPEYSLSNIKLVSFAVSASIFLAMILHYIGLIYKAFTELSGPKSRQREPSEEEARVTSLMGRSNASNTIVGTKKGR